MTPLSDNEIDELSSGYGAAVAPDVEAALARVRSRIGVETMAPAKVRSLPARRWLGVAAALLLLVSAAFFLLRDSGTTFHNTTSGPLAVELSDGTSAVLQEGARLRYAEDFNVSERLITLEGQGFFVVHKDNTRPFLVRTANAEMRVTGTEFNLRVENGELEVEVSEGSVALSRAEQTITVSAKECGLAKTAGAPVLMEAPHLNRHAWRTGKLYFEDAELPVVLEAIRSNFGHEVRVPADCNYPVSGTFPANDPLEVLAVIARLGGGSVTADDAEANVYRFVGVCK